MRPCCDTRSKLAIIGITDMVFGVILLSLYIQSLLFPRTFPEENFTDYPWLKLLLLFPIIVNTFQVLACFYLLSSLKQTDPLSCLAKGKMWFHSALLTLSFLAIKFVLLFFFYLHHRQCQSLSSCPTEGEKVLIILTLGEILEKVLGLLVVQSYTDEMKIRLRLMISFRNQGESNPYRDLSVQYFYPPSAPRQDDEEGGETNPILNMDFVRVP